MASFCTKCGASVPPDTQFCPNCGSPMAVATPATTPYQPAAAPYQPSASQTYQPGASGPYQAAPAPQKSGGALKIILIVVAVVVFLGILGIGLFAFTAYRIAHSIHVTGSGDGGKVTINAGGGTITANSQTAPSGSELGTDIYPGATTGKGSMKMDLPSGSVVTGVFVTSDSKDKVVAFYKSKFGSDAAVYDSAKSAVVSWNKGNQETVMVTVTSDSAQYEGKTQIAIVHSKSNKAP